MTHSNEPGYRIQLLGRLEVRRNGELLNIAQRKAMKRQKALACLILAHGQVVTDSELIKSTGIDPDRNAVNSLKVMIHRIREMLPGEPMENASCINRTSGGYAWSMDFDAKVDLFDAETVCDRVIFARELSGIEREDILALVGLFAGNLLLEMKDEPWVELAQFRLAMQYKAAMSRAFTLMWNENAVDQIIFTCLLGLSKDPMESIFKDNLKRARRVANQYVAEAILHEVDEVL